MHLSLNAQKSLSGFKLCKSMLALLDLGSPGTYASYITALQICSHPYGCTSAARHSSPKEDANTHLVPIIAVGLPVEALEDHLQAAAGSWTRGCSTSSLQDDPKHLGCVTTVVQVNGV